MTNFVSCITAQILYIVPLFPNFLI